MTTPLLYRLRRADLDRILTFRCNVSTSPEWDGLMTPLGNGATAKLNEGASAVSINSCALHHQGTKIDRTDAGMVLTVMCTFRGMARPIWQGKKSGFSIPGIYIREGTWAPNEIIVSVEP